jgi:hypothetical protein
MAILLQVSKRNLRLHGKTPTMWWWHVLSGYSEVKEKQGNGKYQPSKNDKRAKKPVRCITKRFPTNACEPDDQSRPVIDGQRFRLNLVMSNTRCTDEDGQLYEYGQFDDMSGFREWAHACVKDVHSELNELGSFRGIDFNYRYNECRCPYDEGSLDRRDSRSFDSTERDGYGYVSIGGARSDRTTDIYCAKLVEANFLEAELSLLAA